MTVERIVRRLFLVIDGNDFDGMAEIFATDAVYRRPGHEPMIGVHAIRDFYCNKRLIAEGRHEITAILVDGDHAAVQGGFAGLSRHGQPLDLGFVDIYVIHRNKIAERWTYFDSPAA